MSEKKECFVCKESKPISRFSKNKRKSDGLEYRCKGCAKLSYQLNREAAIEKAKAYRAKNIDRINEYDKKRSKEPKRKNMMRAAVKKYSQTEVAKSNARKSVKKSKEKYRNATLSRSALSNAIISGRVIREPSCSVCSSTKLVQGHHDDYDRPLDIIWLCVKCHRSWHNLNTPLNREYGIFNPKQQG